MDDSSLDDFFDTDEESAEEDDQQSTSEQTADTEPAAVTAEWTPAGAHCDDCGEETQRLWTDGDSTVCRSCKEW